MSKSLSQIPSFQQDHNCILTFRFISISCFLGFLMEKVACSMLLVILFSFPVLDHVPRMDRG